MYILAHGEDAARGPGAEVWLRDVAGQPSFDNRPASSPSFVHLSNTF